MYSSILGTLPKIVDNTTTGVDDSKDSPFFSSESSTTLPLNNLVDVAITVAPLEAYEDLLNSSNESDESDNPKKIESKTNTKESNNSYSSKEDSSETDAKVLDYIPNHNLDYIPNHTLNK